MSVRPVTDEALAGWSTPAPHTHRAGSALVAHEEGNAQALPQMIPAESANRSVRIRLTLAYDGTHFRGWAIQPGLRTAQGVVEQALTIVCRRPITLTVAGRTDAGVHAREQVAHADIPADVWEQAGSVAGPHRAGTKNRGASGRVEHTAALPDAVSVNQPDANTLAGIALVKRLNGLLARDYGLWAGERNLTVARGSSDVVIHRIEAVSHDFDARFSALGRAYCYRIADAALDPMTRFNTWWVGKPLDVALMRQAAQTLLGQHDFLSYCKPRDGATTIRTLTKLDIVRAHTTCPSTPGAAQTPESVHVEGDASGSIIEFHVEADAFCHSMVRSLVGALAEVGRGAKPVGWPRELLDARTRDRAAPLAPPQGLTLDHVTYPDPSLWAARQRESRHRRDEAACC